VEDSAQCLQPSQPCVETHTDVCDDSEGRQADDVTSVLRHDERQLDQSSTACLPTFDSSKVTFDSECRDCQLPRKILEPDNLVMYLHAYCYKVRFCDSILDSQRLIIQSMCSGKWSP